MDFIIRLLVSGAAVFLTAQLLALFGMASISGFMSAIIVAVVLGILNAIVKPVIQLLTLPITVLTLGLFLLVINAAMILLADKLVSGFAVSGWISALIFSFVITFIGSALEKMTGTGGKKD